MLGSSDGQKTAKKDPKSKKIIVFLGHPVESYCIEQSIFGRGHFDESVLHRWRWWPTRVESPTDNNHSNIDGAAALCSMSQETRHVALKIFLFWSTPKKIIETPACLLLFFCFFKFLEKIFWRPAMRKCKVIGVGERRPPASRQNLCSGIKTALNHPLSTFCSQLSCREEEDRLSAKRSFLLAWPRNCGAHLIIHFGISFLGLLFRLIRH